MSETYSEIRTLRGTFKENYAAYLAGDEAMIFHCHHYNTFLQATLEDTKDYIDIYSVLTESAAEIVNRQLSAYFSSTDIVSENERKAVAEEFFSFCGFGKADLSKLTENGGEICCSSEHYSYGWKNKFGMRKEHEPPVSFFAAGFFCGAAEAVYMEKGGTFRAKQTACLTKGDEFVAFSLAHETGEKRNTEFLEKKVFQTWQFSNREDTGVDYLGILAALGQMTLQGQEKTGLIDAFGVLLTRMYAQYYCLTSYRMLAKMNEKMGNAGVEIAVQLLTEAGHVCAFNTFGGIMESAEWMGLIKPMLKSKEDWVHGIVAVINALGWGFWVIEELIPGEKLRMKVISGYEANAFIPVFGKSEIPISFLANGGCSGIMNLIYVADIHEQPVLDDVLYKKISNHPQKFKTVQVACRAMGAQFDIFETTRV